MGTEIRDTTDDDPSGNVAVIRESFATVADEMGLTEDNCPTHPSFISVERLEALRARGLRLFGLFLDGEQVGFVALERAGKDLYYIEKLAVVPRCRHRGFGGRLLAYACDRVRETGGRRVSVAIIDGHRVLERWYDDLGFRPTGTRQFDHLPFAVRFMEKELD